MTFAEETMRLVSRLNERGQQCLETRDHAEALVHYSKALSLLTRPELALVRFDPHDPGSASLELR